MRTIEICTVSKDLDFTAAGDIAVSNFSASDAYVIPLEEFETADKIANMELRNRVFNNMYRLIPGQRRTLPVGQYKVLLNVGASVVFSFRGKARKPALNNVSLN